MEPDLLKLLLIFAPLIFLSLTFFTPKKKNLPPSPSFAFPIIGHLHLIQEPLHLTLQNLVARYGPILYLKLGVRRLLVVSSPSAVEECLNRNDIVFANRPRTLAGDALTYDYKLYVVTPYGDLWRNLRRVSVVEIFSSLSLQRSAALREAELRHALRRLFKSNTQKVDLKFLFNLIVININYTLINGKREIEADDEETEKAKLQEFKDLFVPTISMDLCDFFPILRTIGLAGKEKEYGKLHKRRDEYAQSLIQEVRDSKVTGNSGGKTEESSFPLIHKLLALQNQNPELYSDDIIKSMILVLFIAGTDTPSVTLEWAMSLLLSHPEELRKLRAEIDNQISTVRLLTDSDLSKLPYLRSVVNETLRLYPPAPLLIPHCASEDCTVAGYNVPRDTILMVNAWGLHMDPTLWDRPEKFMPERFREEEQQQQQEGVQYLPFGSGRRMCAGANMGLRIAMLGLGLMVQCFEWEVSGTEVDFRAVIEGGNLSKEKPLEAVCKSYWDNLFCPLVQTLVLERTHGRKVMIQLLFVVA